jgi:hypothetical protein
MFLTIHRKKAQTVAEYAILIGLVIAAITGVQVFVRQGISKQVKGAVEYLNDQMLTGTTVTDMTGYGVNSSTNQDIDEFEDIQAAGVIDRSSNADITSTRNEALQW